MPNFRPKAPYLVLIFGLGCIVASHLLVPINPEYSLPGIPECFSVAVLSGLLYYALYGATSLRRPHWLIRPREKFLLGYIWAIVLLITGPRALWSLFFTPGQAWTPCLAVPGLALKLECFLQASYNNTYGLRTYFTLVIATLLGTLAFLLARTVRGGGTLMLGAIAFGPVLVAIANFICIALGIEQLLPQWLMYNDFTGFAFARFTQVFGNPSWVWPYFAPGLAIAIWRMLTASRYGQRLIAVNVSLLLLSSILKSQQSGAIVLCFVYILVCNSYALYLWHRKLFWGLCGLSTTLLLIGLSSDRAIQFILAQNSPFIDQSRLEIWSSALMMFRDSPILGHGYASWFQVLKQYPTSYGLFDTAHNFYVQVLAELGLVHASLIWIALLLMSLTSFANIAQMSKPNHLKLLTVLGIFAFLVSTAVQEVDYLRPIFYIHTMFWGGLIGYQRPPDTPVLPQPSRTATRWNTFIQTVQIKQAFLNRPVFNTPIAAIGQRLSQPIIKLIKITGIQPKTRHGLVALSGVATVGCLFCLLNFNLGASVFEADLTQPGFIARWFGPQVRLTAFGSLANKSYSIYSAGPYAYPMTVNQAGDLAVTTDAPTDELWLSPENGNVLLPKHHTYTFEPAFGVGSRWVSVLTPPPFVQSNLGMAWSRGMGPWEEFEGVTGRWCGADCWFVAKSCGRRDRLDLTLAAPRPDLAPDGAITVAFTAYSLPADNQFSRQSLSGTMEKLSQQTLKFSAQEQPKIEVNGSPDTAWYLVHAATFSTFTEPPAEDGTPGRELGVAVLESDCQGLR